MGTEVCRTCKFYWLEGETTCDIQTDEPLHPDDYEAECRRFPPVRGDVEYFGKMDNPSTLCGFFSGPIVQAINWCGEWKHRQ